MTASQPATIEQAWSLGKENAELVHVVWGRVDNDVVTKAMAFPNAHARPFITFLESDDDSDNGQDDDASQEDSGAYHHLRREDEEPKAAQFKRVRYRSQIHRLKRMVNFTPFVDIRTLKLPAGIADDDELVTKLYTALSAHQESVLHSLAHHPQNSHAILEFTKGCKAGGN